MHYVFSKDTLMPVLFFICVPLPLLQSFALMSYTYTRKHTRSPLPFSYLPAYSGIEPREGHSTLWGHAGCVPYPPALYLSHPACHVKGSLEPSCTGVIV